MPRIQSGRAVDREHVQKMQPWAHDLRVTREQAPASLPGRRTGRWPLPGERTNWIFETIGEQQFPASVGEAEAKASRGSECY